MNFQELFQKVSQALNQVSPPIKLDFNNSDVVEAFNTFPKPVLKDWLRFRREAAARLHPDWASHHPQEALAILDECAAYAASLN